MYDYYYIEQLINNWKKNIKTNNKEIKAKINSKQYYKLTELCNYLDYKDKLTLQKFILALSFEYLLENNTFEEIEDLIMDGGISCHL